MIMLWNRKEVYNGFDIGQLARVRDTLSAANIRYIYKTVWQGGLRGGFSNLALSTIYYVYVHKRDFDRAQYELHKRRN